MAELVSSHVAWARLARPRPRTGEKGAASNVTLYYFPSATSLLNPFGQAIEEAQAVFIARTTEAHETLSTASQYLDIPITLTAGLAAQSPAAGVAGPGWWSPFYWGWPTLMLSSCFGCSICLVRWRCQPGIASPKDPS